MFLSYIVRPGFTNKAETKLGLGLMTINVP